MSKSKYIELNWIDISKEVHKLIEKNAQLALTCARGHPDFTTLFEMKLASLRPQGRAHVGCELGIEKLWLLMVLSENTACQCHTARRSLEKSQNSTLYSVKLTWEIAMLVETFVLKGRSSVEKPTINDANLWHSKMKES
uniref:Uncharacterized protein n=1 Tax=Vespula pensylvanica TaxID=30213 RepID=A0A834UH53_VESPE|nr:hypothetical protein H0235_001551 [Vespula pensylvanica]